MVLRFSRGGRQLGLLLLVFGALAFESVAPASAQSEKRVLVVYSTRRDAQIVNIGERELPRILEQGLGHVDYYSEYIDQARFPDTADQAFREFFLLKYKNVHFDAVIAIQDAALDLVREARNELFQDTPIVYFATSPVSKRIDNATGLVTGFDLADTLALIADLQPDVRRIFVVTGASPSDDEYESIARSQFRPFENRFAISYLNGLPTSALESSISSLPPNSAVYYLMVNRNADGGNVHPLVYLDRLVTIANAPVYCWVDSAFGRGIVGGSLKDQTAQLEAIGRLTLRVLSGQPADSIPVSSPHLNVRQVDWRQLRRWGISESRVPQDTRLLFRNPSVWDRYWPYMLGAAAVLLAQTLLIAGLLVERRMRRRAEEQVRASDDALRSSYERLRDLGSRLLQAQDTERSHIARELHDDISQQIALLSIDVELLSGVVPPDAEALADEAMNRTQELVRSVHDLSHRLHPTKLRLIGLVSALQSLQRELSRSDTAITFTHDGVPGDLPPNVTLSLYRIVQEALQNALKYSRAKAINVALRGSPEGLVLTIVDNGVGFDVGASWGKGLGLISIGERIEAIGGTLDIRSAPGGGTSFTIKVPHAVEQRSEATTVERAG
jgi:signal transduction histidine kinase